jgi:hypothetical protein
MTDMLVRVGASGSFGGGRWAMAVLYLVEGCSAALNVLENCSRNFSEGSSGESKNFFYLPGEPTILVVHLELGFREFSKKFEMALLGYSGAWGKLIHEKNLKLKILWHCPFKLPFACTKL